MSVTIETLYGHLNTLTKQWFYDKDEIDTKLDDKADTSDVPTKTSDLTNDSNFISTSATSGLIKNDGTIDTTEYQEAGDYIETSATSGLVKNDGTIDTTEYQEAGDYIETSATSGLVKNDGSIDTTAYAAASSLAAVATSGSYNDLSNVPSEFTPASHTHTAGEVTDTNAYSNLGTSANATQTAINYAIDTKIGSLLSVELIEVVASLPTASADTMNALYLVAESTAETQDAYEIFVTVRTGTEGDYSYAWEKVDTARIDLSGYATTTHTHGNITTDGKIGSNADYFVYTTTNGAVTSKEKIGNITTDGAIGSTSGQFAVTTTDGVLTTSSGVDEIDAIVQSLISYGNQNS